MQSVASVSRAVYRIIFRSGTPQRIHFSAGLLVIAVIVFTTAAVIAHRWLFSSGVLQIGLFLFTVLTGGYIGAALLTRKVPRSRLRATITAVMLLLATAELFLLLVAGLAVLIPAAHTELAAAATVAALSALTMGISNCLRFATGDNRASAIMTTAGFITALAAFYAIMQSLLETVFS